MYEQKIRTMCAANLASLQVSYMHLMEAEPVLAVWVVDAPKDMLDVLNEAATRHTLMLFPSYGAIQKEIHVRITHVPILDSLRDLRRSHLDCLVQVHGVVTRRSAVMPQLQIAHYQCMSCKRTQGPFRVEGSGEDVAATYMPDSCPFCESENSARFKLHPTLSQYRNFQRVNLQETPGSVPPGRVPRQKEVFLTDDLIDVARPGEEVEVTGIYQHSYDSSYTLKSGFPVFNTFITANHVQKKEDASSSSNLTETDVAKILELARDPKIGDRIVQSIAPSIFGHDNCKMALAMSLFGGVPKNINDKHRIRGDCNVLLLGDPGTAKSQLLKYAENTAPRAVYSTGKGASAVGLTASVHKDPRTKEWTLEGGALVLADRGVCLIDEFDKMNEKVCYLVVLSSVIALFKNADASLLLTRRTARRFMRLWNNRVFPFPRLVSSRRYKPDVPSLPPQTRLEVDTTVPIHWPRMWSSPTPFFSVLISCASFRIPSTLSQTNDLPSLSQAATCVALLLRNCVVKRLVKAARL